MKDDNNNVNDYYLRSIRDFYKALKEFLITGFDFSNPESYSYIESNLITEDKKFGFRALIPQAYNYSIIEGEYYHREADKILNEIKELQDGILAIIREGLYKLKDEEQRQQESGSSSSNRVEILHVYSAFCSEVMVYVKESLDFGPLYKYLVRKINNRLKKEEKQELIFPYYEKSLDELRNQPPTHQKVQLHLFPINLKLAEYDEGYEGYTCSDTAIKSLIDLALLIQKLKEACQIVKKDLVVDYLTEKCNFLLLKLYRRFKSDGSDYIITLEEGERTFNLKKLKSELYFFKDFDELAQRHYNYPIDFFGSEDAKKRAMDYKIFLNDTDSAFSVAKVHFLCKYLKKNSAKIVGGADLDWEYSSTLALMSSWVKRVKEIIVTAQMSNDQSNQFAFESALSLLLNLMLLLKGKRHIELYRNSIRQLLNIDEISEFYNQNHSQSKLSNLGIHASFRDFIGDISELLEKALISEPKLEDFDTVKIAELSKLYFDADVKIRELILMNERKGLLPLYLTIPECFHSKEISVALNDSNGGESEPYEEWGFFHASLNTSLGRQVCSPPSLHVFLDSSYILPANFQQIMERHSLNHNKFSKYIAHISTILSLKKIENYKDDVFRRFDDKVKESQSVAIQIIGFFIGVITFTLSSVTVVPKFSAGNTYEVIFTFMLVFAGSLTLFTLVLSYITRYRTFDRERNGGWLGELREPKFWAIAFISVAIIITGIYYIHRFSEKNIKVEGAGAYGAKAVSTMIR